MQYGTKLIICNKGISVSVVLLGPRECKTVLFIIVSYKWQSREESGDFIDPNTRV